MRTVNPRTGEEYFGILSERQNTYFILPDDNIVEIYHVPATERNNPRNDYDNIGRFITFDDMLPSPDDAPEYPIQEWLSLVNTDGSYDKIIEGRDIRDFCDDSDLKKLIREARDTGSAIPVVRTWDVEKDCWYFDLPCRDKPKVEEDYPCGLVYTSIDDSIRYYAGSDPGEVMAQLVQELFDYGEWQKDNVFYYRLYDADTRKVIRNSGPYYGNRTDTNGMRSILKDADFLGFHPDYHRMYESVLKECRTLPTKDWGKFNPRIMDVGYMDWKVQAFATPKSISRIRGREPER